MLLTPRSWTFALFLSHIVVPQTCSWPCRSTGVPVAGVTLGLGEGEGEGERVGEDEGEGDGLADVTPPVHVTPFRAKPEGAGLEPFQLPLNPNSVLPPLGRPPL
jgi:hypothetical protein